MKHGRKGNNELLIIFICAILIILILILASIIGITNKSNLKNNEIEHNIKEDISSKNEENEDEIIKVIIDNPQNEENNENKNEQNNEQQGENPSEGNNQNKPVKDTPKYYINVNNKANVVTIYKKDANGEYTVPIKAMVCSIGDATPTSGVYKTSDKYTWRLLQGNVYGQYAVRITGHILFHSVPYVSQSKNTLEWLEYDKLGTAASLGCIRLTVEDAKWIYSNCEKGTQVEFYSSTTPGPLGKPVAKKISSYNENLKNWDPTDPDPNNPWNTYVETSTTPVTPTSPEVYKPVEEVLETSTPSGEQTEIDDTITNNGDGIDANLGIGNV